MPSVSAQYSIILRVEIDHQPGMLGRVATAIGDAGGSIGSVDLIAQERGKTLRDIAIETAGEDHATQIGAAVDGVDGARLVDITDRTFQMHLGGKIEQHNKLPIRTRDDLSRVYTPGVARVCMAINKNRDRAFQYTIKRNTVAVVSDGTAVLGLGDIGPEAAMPVMEGKCALFKEFGGVDAFPICLSTKDPDKIVEAVTHMAPTFGGINLEDISAPRCFEVEDRLKALLDIPVFHDDQHGTAIVVLAALRNAARLTGRSLGSLRAVVSGAGAAGVAVTTILREAGIGDITVSDSKGVLHDGRGDLTDVKRRLADVTNDTGLTGSLADSLRGADVFIGVSGGSIAEHAVAS